MVSDKILEGKANIKSKLSNEKYYNRNFISHI
jgi:hypothetical protein